MIPPVPVVYFLVLLLLFASALLIHLNASAVSLPLEPLTIPTIMFPIAAGLVTYLHSALTTGPLQSASALPTSAQRRRRRRTVNLARAGSQTLLGTFAVALATLLLQRIVPNQSLECGLEAAWTRMWRDHNAAAIRNVEQTLGCCGFRSVRDRPWPFPDKEHPGTDGCLVRLGHDTPCYEPWKAYMQRSAGGAFAVVAIVTLMQIANILLHAGYFNRRLTPWFSHSRPLLLPAAQDDPVRRPLLEGGSGSANGASGRIIEEGDDEERTTRPPQAPQRNGPSSSINIVGNARSSGLGSSLVGHPDVEDGWRDAARDGIRNGGRRKSDSSSSDDD